MKAETGNELLESNFYNVESLYMRLGHVVMKNIFSWAFMIIIEELDSNIRSKAVTARLKFI